jgi:hypothetical protein
LIFSNSIKILDCEQLGKMRYSIAILNGADDCSKFQYVLAEIMDFSAHSPKGMLRLRQYPAKSA